MTREEIASLKQRLWPADAVRPVRIYAVLDCARDPSIHDLLSRSYREKGCLFAGKLHPDLERAAPHLLELQAADSVTDEILRRGWEEAWGILIQSDSSFRTVRRHLRTLLRVRTEDGRILLFRFYDPRVLATYLPTCTPEELRTVYGDAIRSVYGFSSNAFHFESSDARV